MTYDLSDSDDLNRFLKSVEAINPQAKGVGTLKFLKFVLLNL